MKTISVQMTDAQYAAFGLSKDRFSFAEIADIVAQQASSVFDDDQEVDAFFTPEMLAEIDQSIDDYYSGRETGVVLTTHEDIDRYFESLCATK